MKQRLNARAVAMGMIVGIGGAGITQAASVLGHPNPHSQVGRQGTMNNQLNRGLDGKTNRHRKKKVHNNTATPMPASMVRAGARIFQAQCESCHGPEGSGSLSAPRLSAPSGVGFTFKTEPGLEAYIQAHMPGDHPGTMTGSDVKNVSAYVWSLSKAK